jgi:hypothetical protein
MPIEKQIRRIIKLNQDIFNSDIRPPRTANDDIEDLFDGAIYKELYDSEFGYLFHKNEAFTFSINTDGISICDQSNVTIWPVFLAINEIPLEKRFCLDNIIIAGINFFFKLLLQLFLI